MAPPSPLRRGTGRRRDARASSLSVEALRIVDGAALILALVAVVALTNVGPLLEGAEEFLAHRISLRNALLIGALLLFWQLVFALLGLYDRQGFSNPSEELRAVAAASLIGAAPALLLPLASRSDAFQVHDAVLFWVAAVVAATSFRAVLVGARRPAQHPSDSTRVLIVGSGPRTEGLLRSLQRADDEGVEVVGFVDTNDAIRSRVIRSRWLGPLEWLEELLVTTVVDEVVIALPIRSRYAEIQEVIRVCERVGVESKYLADVFESSLSDPSLDRGRGVSVVALKVARGDFRIRIKRGIDVVGAAAGLVVLAPLFLVIAAAVRLTSPGPVLYAQTRVGYNKRRFTMYKFRTMADGAERVQDEMEHLNEMKGPTFKIKDDPRMTRVGRLLRRTSMDELPQLFNVLVGQMSLVGPRPLPERDVGRFNDSRAMRRFSMRPGVTCLWQISGRSDVDFDEWLALDLRYIDNWSLALDLSILLRTFPAVIRGHGAS